MAPGRLAKLRRANIDAAAGAVDEIARLVGRIRGRWPEVRVMLRADSGFAREVLMAWCEANGVDYLFGLARNRCLLAAIEAELDEARAEHQQTGKAARRFADFTYATRGLRRIALADTDLAQATCASIRLKFLKIRARVTVSVRRVKIAMASACPQQATFALAHARLRAPPG